MLLEEIDVLIGWVCMKITYQRTKTTLILWKDSVSIGKSVLSLFNTLLDYWTTKYLQIEAVIGT